MRGKYKSSAEARQAREDFERRAIAAEQRADRAEKELSELKASTDRQICSLRAEMTEIANQRDRAVTPEIKRLNTVIGKATAERDALREIVDGRQRTARRTGNAIKGLLRSHGVSEDVIEEVKHLTNSIAHLDHAERSMHQAQADAAMLRQASNAMSK